MEKFAQALTDLSFGNQLLIQLSGHKPFQNFKRLMDTSVYQQDWFGFKKKANVDGVKWPWDQDAT